MRFMKHFYNETFVIRIDVEDQSEAFEIFERTNARGKPLEIYDLLKNYLFSKGKDIGSDYVKESWNQFSTDSGTNIIRVLKYFWISRRGYVVNRDLYRRLREYASAIETRDFISELLEFSSFYKAYSDDDPNVLRSWIADKIRISNAMYIAEIARSCNAVRAFRVTQAIPVFFAIFYSAAQSDDPNSVAKSLINVCRKIEFHHFINNRICGRIGNDIEKLYAEFSKKFYDSSDLIANINLFEQALKERTAKLDEFAVRFCTLSYVNDTDKYTIRYVFDLLSNVGVKEGQRSGILDYHNLFKNLESEFDIEHLLAKSLVSDEESYVHSIGNLMVFPKQINGILQNDDFAVKMDKLRNPQNYKNNIKNVPAMILTFADEHAGKPEWTEKDIDHRAQQLARQVYAAVTEQANYK